MKTLLPVALRTIFVVSLLSLNACSSDEETPSAPVIESIEPMAGSAGREVTITGSGFAGSSSGNTVKFKGTLAPIVSATSTKLVVRAPVSATGEVTLETKHGLANGPTFTYQSTEKMITSFLVNDYPVAMNITNITLSIPAGTDVTTLAPSITLSGNATISPASGTPQNFTSPVEYTVTAEDNSTQKYTVRVDWLYGITALSLSIGTSTTYPVELDHVNFLAKYDISFFNFRNSAFLFNATPQTGFLLTPPSGSNIDIKNPGVIHARAANAVVQTYTWKIRNKDAHLFDFTFSPGKYGFQAHQGYAEEVAGMDITDQLVRILETQPYTNVVPSTIQYSEHATLVPASSAAQNFSNDVVYQITSETGIVESYRIRVLRYKVLIPNDYKSSHKTIEANGNSFWHTYESVSEITGAKLIRISNGAEVSCTISKTVSGGTNYVYVDPTAAFPAGDYQLQFQLADGSTVLIRLIHRAS